MYEVAAGASERESWSERKRIRFSFSLSRFVLPRSIPISSHFLSSYCVPEIFPNPGMEDESRKESHKNGIRDLHTT